MSDERKNRYIRRAGQRFQRVSADFIPCRCCDAAFGPGCPDAWIAPHNDPVDLGFPK